MKPLKILFSGMIAGDPWQGGATWAVLQYLLGLRRLGHEVYFVEPIRQKSVRPVGSALADSDNAKYFDSVVAEFGLRERSALLLAESKQSVGLSYEPLRRAAEGADVLINVSGMLTDENLISRIPVRAYLDIDPAFNQFWSAVQKIDMRFVGHTHFVTIGMAIGAADCPVPTCGLRWAKTLQPIVLEHWPVAEAIERDALTTIANWRGYGSIEHDGVTYGQKVHSLRRFFSLPTMTEERFQLALAIHPDEKNDLVALEESRWGLLDPASVANTPANYQQFIRGSKAEFGIAKSGYVHSRCGWFSDRSICYLASGRPVIAQDTGFGRYVPTGDGLFSFQNSEEVLAAIEKMNSNYSRHSARAREIAKEYFDSNKVLSRLLKNIGA